MNHELSGNESGLIAYYNFDQGIPGGNNIGVTTLNDGTTNGNNGTLNDFALIGSTSNWIGSDAPIFAPCPTGNVTLTTQAEVDALLGCTHITGSLTIGPSTDIVNLDGLECIESISAGFNLVNNSVLVDMSGLTNLTTVGNQISILNNPLLVTVDLEDINGSLGGSLEVQNNNGLVTLLGPTNLTTIGTNPFIAQDLFITGNPVLANITGFENLTSIGWRFRIANTLEENLPDFANLMSVGTDIVFESNQNALLINIPNVTGILATDFKIQNNASLITLNAPVNLTSTGNDCFITGNPNLTNLSGLENLASVGWRFRIADTKEDVFPDFSNLTNVGTDIAISNNDNVGLIKLPNVTGSLGTDFKIQNNASLHTLMGPLNLTLSLIHI